MGLTEGLSVQAKGIRLPGPLLLWAVASSPCAKRFHAASSVFAIRKTVDKRIHTQVGRQTTKCRQGKQRSAISHMIFENRAAYLLIPVPPEMGLCPHCFLHFSQVRFREKGHRTIRWPPTYCRLDFGKMTSPNRFAHVSQRMAPWPHRSLGEVRGSWTHRTQPSPRADSAGGLPHWGSANVLFPI